MPKQTVPIEWLPGMLFDAIYQRDTPEVTRLLDDGLDPNLVRGDETPLQYAAGVSNVEVVQLLLSRGATDRGKMPMLEAALSNDPAIINLLLAHGGDVNLPDERGWTPLMEAATWGNVEAATTLVAKGADLNAKTLGGTTALKTALEDNHADMVELLRNLGAAE